MIHKNDFVMRQIRDMVHMLAKIVLGRDTIEYEDNEDMKFSEMSHIYTDLIRMVDEGKINEAENLLFDEINKDENKSFEMALRFYDYLNSLSDVYLEENNYSREEVKEGVQNLADSRGLGMLGKDLGEF